MFKIRKKQVLIFSIIILIIIIGYFPIAFSQDAKVRIKNNNDTDWWPSFKHDSQNTGTSTSNAPDTNNLIWEYQTKDRILSSPVVFDNNVYVGSDDGYFYCLDAESGEKIWTFTNISSYREFGSAVVSDSKVYVYCQDHYLYCLDAENGEKIWQYKIFSQSIPVVSDGRVYMPGNTFLYCLDSENGNEIWRYEAFTLLFTSPAVFNEKVYLADVNGSLYCFDSGNGLKIWEYKNDETDVYVSSPAISNGKVYAGASAVYQGNGRVYCLDAESGEKIWTYTTENVILHSSPTIANGRIYIGTDKTLDCLNAESGKKVWEHPNYLVSLCSASFADEKVYFGACDGMFYCLNAENGNEIWSYQTGECIQSSPAIADGKIYIGSFDGKVYCFGDNDPPSKPLVTYNEISDKIVVKSTDPNNDQIRYGISWNNDENIDTWTEFHDSGKKVRVDCQGHKGSVGVIAEDINGGQSDWIIQESKLSIKQIFLNLFDRIYELFS